MKKTKLWIQDNRMAVRWEKKGMTEDEMAGWHHGLDGSESE